MRMWGPLEKVWNSALLAEAKQLCSRLEVELSLCHSWAQAGVWGRYSPSPPPPTLVLGAQCSQT